MEVKDYCSAMETELTAWKAKMYDVVRKVNTLDCGEKERILSSVGDLHILLEELGVRVDQLRTECPTSWSPFKDDIDEAHVDMRSKYEETMELIGRHAAVSVPG
jgi:hypothetical protein